VAGENNPLPQSTHPGGGSVIITLLEPILLRL
jgi:hypothetical protein